MEEKIVTVLNEMSEYLSITQMKKLQEVIIKTFAENEAAKVDIENEDFLNMFLAAKRIEGCSERTDIETLEEILWREVGTKQDYENEFGTKPLGEFVRGIVGLDMNAAKEAFSEYLTNTSLDSRQIYFVNQIVEYIVHNGMLKDFSVLQESPFTDQGSVVEIFTDISVWLGIKKVIDTINANAVA